MSDAEHFLSDEEIRERLSLFESDGFPSSDCILFAEYLAKYGRGKFTEDFCTRRITEGVNKKNTITPPNLNSKLAKVTLFALPEAPIPAKRTVEQEPKCEPRIIGTARFSDIKPCIAREMVKPIVAVLLCIRPVNKAEASKANKGMCSKLVNVSLKRAWSLRGTTDSDITFIPKKIKPMPNNILPINLCFLFFPKSFRPKPRTIIKRA